MTIDEIVTFLQLAEIKNFSKTAEVLFTSQSTVSARIKNLENELGQQLTFRDKKNMELTPAGHDFKNYASQIYALWSDCRRTISISGRYKRHITIAAPDSRWTNIILPSLRQFIDETPHISFRLLCHHSWKVNQLIVEEKIDIGLTGLYVNHQDLEYVFLQDSPYVLVCHPDLQLPAPSLDPQSIHTFPIIYCNWGDAFLEWFNREYRVRSSFLEVETVFLLEHLLLDGKGISFVPERIVSSNLQAGRLRKVDFACGERMPREKSYLIYKKKNSELINPILQNILRYNHQMLNNLK